MIDPGIGTEPLVESESAADDRHIYAPTTPPYRQAMLAMLLAALMFGVMGVCTKLAHGPLVGRTLPAAEVALVRFAFGAAVMLPFQRRPGLNLWGTDRVGLAMRGLWGGFAVYFYFLSVHFTTLANAQLLNYTSLIFAPLCAAVVLHERLTRRAAGASALAIAGIVIVTGHGIGGPSLGDAYGLASGILSGAAVATVRHLRQTETASSIFFYLCLVGIPIAGLGCILQPPIWPTGTGWLVLLCMGASSVLGQLLMTYGYKFVRTAEGGVLMLTQVLYTITVGALWFGEPATWATAAGGALILAASLLLSAQAVREPAPA